MALLCRCNSWCLSWVSIRIKPRSQVRVHCLKIRSHCYSMLTVGNEKSKSNWTTIPTWSPTFVSFCTLPAGNMTLAACDMLSVFNEPPSLPITHDTSRTRDIATKYRGNSVHTIPTTECRFPLLASSSVQLPQKPADYLHVTSKNSIYTNLLSSLVHSDSALMLTLCALQMLVLLLFKHQQNTELSDTTYGECMTRNLLFSIMHLWDMVHFWLTDFNINDQKTWDFIHFNSRPKNTQFINKHRHAIINT